MRWIFRETGSLVLDASGAIEFLLNTDSEGRLAVRLMDDSEVVCVPHLIDLEIGLVARFGSRDGDGIVGTGRDKPVPYDKAFLAALMARAIVGSGSG